MRAAAGCCPDASANDEPEILELLTEVMALGDEVTWGIDLADGGAALAITILLLRDERTYEPAPPSTLAA